MWYKVFKTSLSLDLVHYPSKIFWKSTLFVISGSSLNLILKKSKFLNILKYVIFTRLKFWREDTETIKSFKDGCKYEA